MYIKQRTQKEEDQAPLYQRTSGTKSTIVLASPQIWISNMSAQVTSISIT